MSKLNIVGWPVVGAAVALAIAGCLSGSDNLRTSRAALGDEDGGEGGADVARYRVWIAEKPM